MIVKISNMIEKLRGGLFGSPLFLYPSWLLLLCLFLLPLTCVKQESAIGPVLKKTVSSAPPKKTEIIIAAVGDVMMPLSIQYAAARNEHGYGPLFEKIASELSAADITFANLETPIDDTLPVSGYPKFNAHPALLLALKKAGVDIISVANNHAMDAGSEGLKRTLNNIEAANLVFTGAGRTKAEASAIRYLKARDISLAFLAFTYDTNERLPKKSPDAPGVNILGIASEADLGRASVMVRQARSGADLVIVSLHWGDEYATRPSTWQRRAASELVEAGADIVLGHHPHVLQPIESIEAADGRIGLVAFSLGNFISSQNAGVSHKNKDHGNALRGDGIVLYITAEKIGDRMTISRAEFIPIWTLREATSKGVMYLPVSLDKEINRLNTRVVRKLEEENMLKLLTYRYNIITKTIMTNVGSQ